MPFYVIGNFVPITQNAPRGCALRRTMQMSQATAAGARVCQGTFFVLVNCRIIEKYIA